MTAYLKSVPVVTVASRECESRAIADRTPGSVAGNWSTNEEKSFIGNYILGSGFTFDDKVSDASPISEMHRIQELNPHSRQLISPYIGGDEVLTSPTQAHRRYVINFGSMSELEARRHGELFAIVERLVKPVRMLDKRDAYRRFWWQHAEKRSELAAAVAPLKRFLFHPNLSVYLAFVFVPVGTIVGAPHNVFIFDCYSAFCTLQSRVHEIWARFFASSFEDRLRYTPSDCFETFPFPEGWRTNATLEDIGKRYYEHRAALMVRDGSDQFGLTELYNRFHDPQNEDEGIAQLRALHEAMDHAVLGAYGWTELAPTYAFIDEQGEGEDDEGTVGARSKKRSVRYRWPDEFRDEVLARLIALNAERAAAEAEVRRLKEEEAAKAKAAEKAAKTMKKF